VRSLFYSGDLALRSARHDFQSTLASLVGRADAKHCVLLLDATMAGRGVGASLTDVAPELFDAAARYDDVVVFARDVEQLIYAYLDLFFYARDGIRRHSRTTFLLSSKLKGVFRLLHAAYIGRTLDQLDPFIVAQYGDSMHAWAESQSLYWLDERSTPDRVPNEGLRVWFLSKDELSSLRPPGRTALVAVGLGVAGDDGTHPNTDLLPVENAAWTLHSNDESLR